MSEWKVNPGIKEIFWKHGSFDSRNKMHVLFEQELFFKTSWMINTTWNNFFAQNKITTLFLNKI